MSSQKKNINGLITVRSSSSRLPGKCFLPFGEESVLSHIIKRSIEYNIRPIICTSYDKSDDDIEELAIKMKVDFYRGPLKNKLKRWSDCAKKFNLKTFHTIDADDPFFDGNKIFRSMQLLDNGNYDGISPTKSSSAGAASVGFSLSSELVNKASLNTADDLDTEMMWYFLEKVPNIKMIELQEDDEDKDLKMRLTLDYIEDYHLLQFIQRELGNMASRQDINQLFLSNPDLHKLNWFRNIEWKESQLAKQIK